MEIIQYNLFELSQVLFQTYRKIRYIKHNKKLHSKKYYK